MPEYHLDAIESARQAIAGQVGKVGSVADGLSAQPVAAAMFGALAGGGALAAAVSGLESTLKSEFSAAEQKLDGVNVALDKVISSVQRVEDAAHRAMTAEV